MLKNNLDKETLERILEGRTKNQARAEASKLIGEDIKKSTFNDFIIRTLGEDARRRRLKQKDAELRLHRQRFDVEVQETQTLKEIVNKDYKRIMVISDLHVPYQHPDAFTFLQEVKRVYNPDLIVCTGDELDNHAMSFHTPDPDLDSAGCELNRGREFLKELHSVFPNMLLCHSNHGSLAYRRGKAYGIPKHFLLSLRDAIFGERTPDGDVIRRGGLGNGWFWADYLLIKSNGKLIKFKHGGSSQDMLSDLMKERCCLVRGHYHGQFNIVYSASPTETIWGMTVGCLIDNQNIAFNYNKVFNENPIYGCGMIIRGQPHLIPMVLENGKWIRKLV